MFRSWLSRSVLVIALLLVCPVGAQAAQSRQPDGHLWATLDGEPIELSEVGKYHCHDLAYPHWTCFATQGQLYRDMANARPVGSPGGREPRTSSLLLGAQSVNYVLIYENSDYSGASALVSNPTPDLSVLGWSNRISSFKSTNGGRPKWWDSTSYSGSVWQWGVSAWVAYVGDIANDRFTSVQNVP